MPADSPAPGAPAALDFEFRDPSGVPFASAKGPVTVRVRQGNHEIAARLEGGGDRFLWPDLCEEIEANLDGGKPSLQERRLPRSCLRWAELWSALPGPVPGRDEARQRADGAVRRGATPGRSAGTGPGAPTAD